jgi:ferredoxin
VAWFHAARLPDEILFAAELARLQEIMPNLTVSIAVSRPRPGWFGLRGRPTRRLMSVAVADLAARDVFCCGPSAFMAEARLIHAAEGGGRETFHMEAFGPAAPITAAADDDPVPAPDNGTFELLCDGRAVTVKNHETILQACLRQGLVIPCGCGQGLCGTCRVRRLSGTVVMNHHGGLDPEEERAGFILACSSRLASDARISLDV